MTWQRLEGSGVSADLRAGLAAKAADPLWYLTRQWQVGEFAGEDAASPVELRATVAWQRLGELRVGNGPAEPIDPDAAPIEARVECEDAGDSPGRPRLAARVAHLLLRMVTDAAPAGTPVDPDLRARLRAAYPLRVPPEAPTEPRGAAELALLTARSFDGLALAAALRAGAAPDPAIAPVADAWLRAVDATLVGPRGGAAGWQPGRLEYSARVAAPAFGSGVELTARGYPGGHLDWTAFDVARTAPPELPDTAPTTTLATTPTPLQYPGMPVGRFWEFEDGAVDWGDIQGGPEDLARYLVGGFATLYGDDWFLLPLELPRGSLAQVRRVQVADCFGRTFPVEATAAVDHRREGPARSWRFTELTGDPAPAAGHSPYLLLAAALPPHERGRPVEEVLFLRDEVANMGWAIERVVEGPAGRRVQREREPPPPAPASGDQAPADGEAAPWGYRLSTPVPANYVPLVPVPIDGGGGEIRFQRGRLATATGSTGARGLILAPDGRLLLSEEEIPSTGIQVTRAWEYARGPDGGLYLWMGRRKRPGRTPRAPGLRHDVVRPPTEVPGGEAG